MKKSLSEIEVIYLKDNEYIGRKYDYFDESKAEEIYLKTCKKYNDGSAIIILRKDGELIKSYRNNKEKL